MCSWRVSKESKGCCYEERQRNHLAYAGVTGGETELSPSRQEVTQLAGSRRIKIQVPWPPPLLSDPFPWALLVLVCPGTPSPTYHLPTGDRRVSRKGQQRNGRNGERPEANPFLSPLLPTEREASPASWLGEGRRMCSDKTKGKGVQKAP